MFRDYCGPTHQAFKALDEKNQAALARDIAQFLGRLNRGGVHSLVVPGEYLELRQRRAPLTPA